MEIILYQRRLFIEKPADKCKNLARFLLLNARSLNNKMAELYYVLYSLHYDVVLITESWLNVATPDSLLDPQNKYIITRHDRQISVGSGVCAVVSKQHAIVVVDLAECYSSLELCVFDLLCMNGRSRCSIFVVYRPPGTNNMSLIHRVSKNVQNWFCQNFVKFSPILIIFGR